MAERTLACNRCRLQTMKQVRPGRRNRHEVAPRPAPGSIMTRLAELQELFLLSSPYPSLCSGQNVPLPDLRLRPLYLSLKLVTPAMPLGIFLTLGDIGL